jgi:glycosyltransferase involved in cell wall biosynthesis
MKTDFYVFQWISDLGGADTRLKELLILLKDDFNITCVPNDEFRLKEKHNTDFLDAIGVKYCMPSDLPSKMEGFAYANCNFRLFKEKSRIDFIFQSGLKLLWSNDMMWTTGEELDAIGKGKVACALFTSPFHRDKISQSMQKANPTMKMAVIENYFDSSTWPYVDRPTRNYVNVGKVSRDDHMKFSEDFPVFYESATEGLPVKFRVMGWSQSLAKKYNWFAFSEKWDLMKTNKLPTQEFFSGLDVFLYNCNYRFIENQSRAIIESQLTGCPVVAPNKWNFPNMIWTDRTGMLCEDMEDFKEAMKFMMDGYNRKKMGKLASDCTREIWCDSVSAKKKWMNLLNYVEN